MLKEFSLLFKRFSLLLKEFVVLKELSASLGELWLLFKARNIFQGLD